MGLFCDKCEHWIHARCCNVSRDVYQKLSDEGAVMKWMCPQCSLNESPFIEDDDNHSLLGSQPHVKSATLRSRGLFHSGMKGILVSHLNKRSVLPKHDELQLMLQNGQSLVFGLSETWLSDKITDSEVGVPGFHVFRRDRSRRGGGMMVYVSEQLKAVRKKDLEVRGVEAV